MVYRRAAHTNSRFARPALALLAALLALGGWCKATVTPAPSDARPALVTSSARALAPAQPCANRFVTHTLDHTTVAGEKVVPLFESNGAGLAIGDLDGDSDQDIVLA